MLQRRGIVLRLIIAVLIIVILVIGAVGLVGSLLTRHFVHETARSVMRSNSDFLAGGIKRLMTGCDQDGVRDLIVAVSTESEVYGDISLVSHPDGEVTISLTAGEGDLWEPGHSACAVCHSGTEAPEASGEPVETVAYDSEGAHLLRIITPLPDEPGCQAPECHRSPSVGPYRGLLVSDYTLTSVDKLIAGQDVFMSIAALVAAILAALVLYLTFRQLLDRPIRALVKGLGALAEDDLTFRFRPQRDDEIGLVGRSFNRMAERIQEHRTELRETNEYLEGIVENSADIIITVNPYGLIQTFNRGAEQVLGYDRSEVIGQRIEMLFADPTERDEAIKQLQESDHVKNYETRFLAKSGEHRQVLLTLSRLRDREGNPIGTFGISKDYTTEKELQRKLLQSERAAAIGQAVTGIQHAIKNMLNTLRGGLYVAQVGHRKGKKELFDEGCTMLEEGLLRIGDLSLHMLTYAREWVAVLEPTDLVELAGRIESAVKQTALERGIELRLDIEPSLTAVRCDPRLIHMMLMDLATNAVDACDMKEYGDEEAPRILLRAFGSEDGTEVVIAVCDNGLGMKPETIEHVFTPFVSSKKWGTGLGLALAARIAELHEGTINVDSKPDAGATFRIILPQKGGEPTPGEANG